MISQSLIRFFSSLRGLNIFLYVMTTLFLLFVNCLFNLFVHLSMWVFFFFFFFFFKGLVDTEPINPTGNAANTFPSWPSGFKS